MKKCLIMALALGMAAPLFSMEPGQSGVSNPFRIERAKKRAMLEATRQQLMAVIQQLEGNLKAQQVQTVFGRPRPDLTALQTQVAVLRQQLAGVEKELVALTQQGPGLARGQQQRTQSTR